MLSFNEQNRQVLDIEYKKYSTGTIYNSEKHFYRSFFQKPFFQKFVMTTPPEVLGDKRTDFGV